MEQTINFNNLCSNVSYTEHDVTVKNKYNANFICNSSKNS